MSAKNYYNKWKGILIMASILGVLAVTGHSCVDSDYDWDKMDKNAVFNLPPVPFGNIDTIFIEGINESFFDQIPDGLPITNLPGWILNQQVGIDSLARVETLENIFTEDITDQLFSDVVTEDVILKGFIDLQFLKDNENVTNDKFKVAILAEVLDGNGNRLFFIKQKDNKDLVLERKDNQLFEFRFPYTEFTKMRSAKSLRFTFLVKSLSMSIQEIIETQNDHVSNFIYIHGLVMKTGGVHFEL